MQCISTSNRNKAKYMKSDIKYTVKSYIAFLCDAMSLYSLYGDVIRSYKLHHEVIYIYIYIHSIYVGMLAGHTKYTMKYIM
jgi:hypothetical protein